jgi:hypothetical protein
VTLDGPTATDSLGSATLQLGVGAVAKLDSVLLTASVDTAPNKPQSSKQVRIYITP